MNDKALLLSHCQPSSSSSNRVVVVVVGLYNKQKRRILPAVSGRRRSILLPSSCCSLLLLLLLILFLGVPQAAAFQPLSTSQEARRRTGERCVSATFQQKRLVEKKVDDPGPFSWIVLSMAGAGNNNNNDEKEAKRLRQERYQKAKQKALQRKKYAEASQAFDLPSFQLSSNDSSSSYSRSSRSSQGEEVQTTTTIGGGTAMIFEMARRMWSSNSNDNNNNNSDFTSNSAMTTPTADTSSSSSSSSSLPPYINMMDRLGGLPRFRRPELTGYIANVNPQFRTQSPLMDSQGYATTIWKNVRKRNKPSLWRYALRTYDRMNNMAQQQQQMNYNNDDDEDSSSASRNKNNNNNNMLSVQRTNIHYEGALAATAKLGLWQRAVEIFQEVEDQQAQQLQKLEQQNVLVQKRLSSSSKTARSISSSSSIPATATRTSSSVGRVPIVTTAKSVVASAAPAKDLPVQVTDRMVTSLIRACVRASRQPPQPSSFEEIVNGNNTSSSSLMMSKEDEQQERLALLALRREPLEKAVEIAIHNCLMNNDTNKYYGLRVEARHVNPLAAAYQELGLIPEANKLLHVLKNRKIGPEPEIKTGMPIFNVNDLGTKDKASYTLLVKGFVSQGDWVGAVDALSEMTTAGLYPVNRHLNEWTEVSERKTKHRNTRSWKKKRDEFWLDSVR